ncbi:MAG: 50S ribosomal protein L24 [Bacillota bacterium]|nr:50S ribosomal protein L24 [Bacillota bacterium]
MTAPKFKVKKGDTVVVIAGKDLGKKGKITEVIPQKGKLFVEGVNIVKRHTKGTQKNPKGGIVQKEAAVDVSNVMYYCSKCKAAVRVGKKIKDNGDRVRICKKCGVELD